MHEPLISHPTVQGSPEHLRLPQAQAQRGGELDLRAFPRVLLLRMDASRDVSAAVLMETYGD